MAATAVGLTAVAEGNGTAGLMIMEDQSKPYYSRPILPGKGNHAPSLQRLMTLDHDALLQLMNKKVGLLTGKVYGINSEAERSLLIEELHQAACCPELLPALCEAGIAEAVVMALRSKTPVLFGFKCQVLIVALIPPLLRSPAARASFFAAKCLSLITALVRKNLDAANPNMDIVMTLGSSCDLVFNIATVKGDIAFFKDQPLDSEALWSLVQGLLHCPDWLQRAHAVQILTCLVRYCDIHKRATFQSEFVNAGAFTAFDPIIESPDPLAAMYVEQVVVLLDSFLVMSDGKGSSLIQYSLLSSAALPALFPALRSATVTSEATRILFQLLAMTLHDPGQGAEIDAALLRANGVSELGSYLAIPANYNSFPIQLLMAAQAFFQWAAHNPTPKLLNELSGILTPQTGTALMGWVKQFQWSAVPAAANVPHLSHCNHRTKEPIKGSAFFRPYLAHNLAGAMTVLCGDTEYCKECVQAGLCEEIAQIFFTFGDLRGPESKVHVCLATLLAKLLRSLRKNKARQRLLANPHVAYLFQTMRNQLAVNGRMPAANAMSLAFKKVLDEVEGWKGGGLDEIGGEQQAADASKASIATVDGEPGSASQSQSANGLGNSDGGGRKKK